MATDADDIADFRRWLVGKLVMSRWAIRLTDTDATMAKRLGVQPEVLAEARALQKKSERKRMRGRPPRLGMPRAGDGKLARYKIYVEPPEEIYRDWCAYRDQRELANAVLLRSVVHHMLQLKFQPSWLHSGRNAWRYKGKWYAQRHIREHNFRFRGDLGDACYRALTERALNTGVAASAIVRWAVTALLEGKLDKVKTLWIVSGLDALYNDPAKYCLKPTIIREKE